jgi:SAM-dependent methyltransferase
MEGDMKPGNEEQAKLWNGAAGQAWVEGQPLLDQMFEPFEQVLVSEARSVEARRVLDIGCGAGATTLALARQLAGRAEIHGIDLSAPLIDVARRRASAQALPAAFVCGDAQTHDFEPGHFDLLVSRFGVMFFDDFAQAFANLRRACASGAGLRFVVFRGAPENPFMTTAERAAAPLLPGLPPRQPDGPGQFAMADRNRVVPWLRDSGWEDIELRAIDVECRFPESALRQYITRLGPVGLHLAQVDAATSERVIQVVGEAFESFRQGRDIRFTAACWLVCARNA